MPKIRDPQYLADKWARRAQAASQDYVEGVRNPSENWQEATLRARDRWRQGIQEAMNNNLWEAGVRGTPNEEWQRRAVELGQARYPQGVAARKDVWQREWEPYRQVLEGLTLPERGPKGAPQNYERVRAVGEALRQAKLRRAGAGR